MKLLQAALVALAASVALQAAAQARPTLDYTDMWWNPGESGWGISIRQKLPVGGTVDALFAVWYTYDPRLNDAASPAGAGFVPLWLVMPGGNWTTPTTYDGKMYVLTGTSYREAWNASSRQLQEVGTFRFQFTDAGNGVFTYAIAPPAGLASANPAFGLPAMSGSKAITRQSF